MSTNQDETLFIQIPPTGAAVFLGPSGVTSSNGLAAGPGSKIYLTNTAQAAGTAASVYGITASGATTVTWQSLVT